MVCTALDEIMEVVLGSAGDSIAVEWVTGDRSRTRFPMDMCRA